jgi:CRISPR-associated DxTHG motif protein
MARKVFISFLGTNNYTECVYSFNFDKSPVVKFVQSALVNIFCSDWTENDKIYIFTTEEALENWKKLQSEWNVNIPFENVMIKSGKNEAEIWEIFQSMFNVMSEDDKLYVDITHSFRSLPLLASSLLQYAKFLRHISVKAIYYGAFETLGNPRDIQERIPNPVDRNAPIFDLTAFSEIQDWAAAANDFIRFGNSSRLNQLTKDDINPVLRLSEGKDEVASNLRKLNDNIDKLSLNIKTNRGRNLVEGTELDNIVNILTSLKQNLITPLNPILDELKNSIKPIFKGKGNRKNILVSVQWCIDKQLIQEGFTLLQEGILSYFLEDYLSEAKRTFISGFLNHYCKNDFDQTKYTLENPSKDFLIAHLMSFNNISKWSSIFSQITEIRNDINHAGIRANPLTANKFEAKLKDLFKKTTELLTLDNSQLSIPDSQLFINLSNHPSALWQAAQLEAASVYGEIIDLPFPAVNPEGDEEYIQSLGNEYVEKIEQMSQGKNVTVHLMGELTLTYCLVNALITKGIKCIASTTERVSEEKDGVKISEFRFKQFRKYK